MNKSIPLTLWQILLAGGSIILISFFGGYLAFKTGTLGYLYRQVEKVVIGDVAYFSDNPEAILLEKAFTDPLIQNELLINPPAKDLSDIVSQIDVDFVNADFFFNGYDQIEITGSNIEGDIFRLDYALDDYFLDSYAYYAPASSANSSCSILLIPGSGFNQSTSIFQKDTDNYHEDILALTEEFCDTYIYVKPNEDFLAIHDGENKLSYNYIVANQINRGGSYSAGYLIDSLAIMKHLQEEYPVTVVMGLSQGGAAALLVALETQPDMAIISSGFSTMAIQTNNIYQIIVPDLEQELNNDSVFDAIQHSPTEFLFTFGEQEGGIYRIEAEEGYTCEFLSPLPTVRCLAHEGAHRFPQQEIIRFFNQHMFGTFPE